LLEVVDLVVLEVMPTLVVLETVELVLHQILMVVLQFVRLVVEVEHIPKT
tara:strand:- start:177 stop:326 length:150 start_codon:yes stop_codon:yes gene_type:complete